MTRARAPHGPSGAAPGSGRKNFLPNGPWFLPRAFSKAPPARSSAAGWSRASKPAHSMTGSRGYRTSRSSQAERPHRRYAGPRRVWLSLACRQVRHSPGAAPSLAHPASGAGPPSARASDSVIVTYLRRGVSYR